MKKNGNEALTNGPRGGANGLSRAQANNSTRKQLQYYDSTPQQPRKHASVLKKQMVSSSSNQNNLLDVTGQNVQKPHGKSSAYLNNANSMVELH